MLIFCKSNVRFHQGKLDELWEVPLLKIHDVFEMYELQTWITSADDSKHMAGSFHYLGLALDFRSYYWLVHIAPFELANKLAVVLGDEFDVVLEKDHIHIEYDP
jgi:hypothetical protein